MSSGARSRISAGHEAQGADISQPIEGRTRLTDHPIGALELIEIGIDLIAEQRIEQETEDFA
jgi:hypothetical protein